MNVLRIEREHNRERLVPEVTLIVDGQRLEQLVEQAGGSPARLSRHKRWTALEESRTWAGLPPEVLSSDHLLGVSDERFALRGKAALFVCPACAEVECSSLLARIDVAAGVIVWRDFEEHVGSSWTALDRLGPFTFDRADYELVVRVAS